MSNLARIYNRLRRSIASGPYCGDKGKYTDAFPSDADPVRMAGKGALRQASVDLTAAADLISDSRRWIRGGWRQVHYVEGLGQVTCFCAQGAIFEATGSDEAEATNPRAAIAVAMADAVTKRDSVVDYNDYRNRNARQVEAKLRDAARRADDLADALPRNGSPKLDTVTL